MGLRLNGSTSGYVELNAPAVAGTTNLTIPLTGFGKVLQVVRNTNASTLSTTSTALIDATGINVTITPRSSTSTLIIIATLQVINYGSTGTNHKAEFCITDSSNNAISGAQSAEIGIANYSYSGTYNNNHYVTMIGYVSPATTNAVTYKVRYKSVNSNNIVEIMGPTRTSQMLAIEIGE